MGKYYLYCKKADFASIAEQFHITPMTARILRNRDLCSPEEIRAFLSGSLGDLHDPFLMKGMREAVSMIRQAIAQRKKIRVIGDYDVDGICSSYIIRHAIESLGGYADVRLPDRILEGYGMNCDMIKEAAADGVELIITCDNGVSAHDAVSEAKQKGIDVIVTDHHEVPYPLVEADVVIDPKQEGCPYPFKELCGGGVAYKLAQALLSGIDSQATEAPSSGTGQSSITASSSEATPLSAEALLDDFLQFAGMATVADLVPLTGENRILAKEGIKRLQQTQNEGLKAILDIRGANAEEINEYYIGFIIGPCLNSAGRLANAKIAYDLLEETDPAEAARKAKELSDLNDERKELTRKQTDEADRKIRQTYADEQNLPKVLVIYLPFAHESVAGIIAGRLKDLYSRPALVITNSDEGMKGSGRSVEAYDLIGEMAKHAQLFKKFGGHKKAAGFSLNEGVQPEDISRLLNDACTISVDDLSEKIWVDMELPFKYVTEEFVQELKMLEPFGLGNEKPLFARRGVKIRRLSVLGKNQNVLKMLLEDEEGSQLDAVSFGPAEEIQKKAERLQQKMTDEETISVFYHSVINEFRNQKTPQARVVDIT